MSDLSPRLGLPYLLPAQAQKHVTHNEALRRLDLLVQLVLEAVAAETPPPAPGEGQAWGLGAAPAGAWAGQAGTIAIYSDAAWMFVTPGPGWRAFDRESGGTRVWDGGGWVTPDAPSLDNLEGLGVNAGYDAVNRLAVSAEATLLSHEGAGHQLKINKAAAGDTASLLFQSGWSGRAEMGLAGGDDWSVKVSGDGAAWRTAMTLDRATGVATFPSGMIANPARAYVVTRVAQVCTSGQNVYIQYEIEDYDTHGFHDPAVPGRLTIPEAGGYQVQAYLQVGGAALAVGEGYLVIERYDAAGTKLGAYPASWGTGYAGIVTPIVQCAPGDHFRIFARQNNAADRTLLVNDPRNFLSIVRIF